MIHVIIENSKLYYNKNLFKKGVKKMSLRIKLKQPTQLIAGFNFFYSY